MSKRIFKLKLGKIHEQFVILPKFMISIYLRKEPYLNHFFRIGRLYMGYVGIMFSLGSFHADLWIAKEYKKGE